MNAKVKSQYEEMFALHLLANKMPKPLREHIFCSRKWRFDFAWPELKIAVEIEGGIYTNGRHVRGKGFEDDCKKYNTATSLGWSVYRFTSSMVKSGHALNFIMTKLVYKNEN